MRACLGGLAVPIGAMAFDYVVVGSKPDIVCAVLLVPMRLGFWCMFATWGQR